MKRSAAMIVVMALVFGATACGLPSLNDAQGTAKALSSAGEEGTPGSDVPNDPVNGNADDALDASDGGTTGGGCTCPPASGEAQSDENSGVPKTGYRREAREEDDDDRCDDDDRDDHAWCDGRDWGDDDDHDRCGDRDDRDCDDDHDRCDGDRHDRDWDDDDDDRCEGDRCDDDDRDPLDPDDDAPDAGQECECEGVDGGTGGGAPDGGVVILPPI